MSAQQRTLKKVFGRYKAKEVDSCLQELENAVSARDQQISSLNSELEAIRQVMKNSLELQKEAERQKSEMETQLTRKTEEMETQLVRKTQEMQQQLARKTQEMQQKLAAQTEARRTAEGNLAVIGQQNEQLTGQIRKLSIKQQTDADTIKSLRDELEKNQQTDADTIQSLRAELAKVKRELDGLRKELSVSKFQKEYLGQRVADQQSTLENIEQMMRDDPTGMASAKAQQILQNAIDTRQKMLEEAEDIRSQALASVRAAYFNTMGFRQEIEEKFVNLQHELDQSMGSLRTLQLTDSSIPGIPGGGKT